MAFEDIERLKDKVNKDPNSKLFIPLAEEYKKAGMFDEAIEVLTKGLERQPDYMSARVSLGKIYIERGMLEEARDEFEKVVSSIPDNLYAHKRLAEIYRDLGEQDKAIKEFKTVLKLNPMDDWAATNLTDIQAGPKPVPQAAEVPAIEEPPDEIAEIIEEEPSEISDIEGALEDIEEIPLEAGEEPLGDIEEIPAEAGEDLLEDIEEIPYEVDEDVLEEVEVITSEKGEEILEGEEEGIQVTEEISEEEAPPVEEVYKPSEVVFEEEGISSLEEEVSEERPVSIQDAEKYIAQDKFLEAMSVYRKILSQDPGNNHVAQRVEELKALLKLLGKDTEALIARLNLLQEHFKKRRDEFRRST
jgi:tetratricopeptide (TPR) repeat protein